MGLDTLREEIDSLDKQLIEILALRFEATHKVGEFKKENTLASVDDGRFQKVIENWRSHGEKLSLSPDLMEKIFINIHEEVVKNHNDLAKTKKLKK